MVLEAPAYRSPTYPRVIQREERLTTFNTAARPHPSLTTSIQLGWICRLSRQRHPDPEPNIGKDVTVLDAGHTVCLRPPLLRGNIRYSVELGGIASDGLGIHVLTPDTATSFFQVLQQSV